MGNREWGIGNREWGMGNGEWGDTKFPVSRREHNADRKNTPHPASVPLVQTGF
jgi:hypothetical protein